MLHLIKMWFKHWRITGKSEAFRAHVITYADDVNALNSGSFSRFG
ncbi:MAG TPA: hypothetical protein VMT28_17325 [Terriglobales bacterium]|nr:hypothetical protein [Terriglobales bacterium]